MTATDLCVLRAVRGRQLHPDPLHDDVGDILLFIIGQIVTLRDAVPFLKAAPAARGRGVLSQKHRMAPGRSPHRSLLAVIGDLSGREPFGHKIKGMRPDSIEPFSFDIFPVPLSEPELRPELRLCQPFEQILIQPGVVCVVWFHLTLFYCIHYQHIRRKPIHLP